VFFFSVSTKGNRFMGSKLFVRNLSWSVTESDLYDLFEQSGTVASVKIPTRSEDGKPRGFAFVEMGSPEAAQKAINECNNVMLYGRQIVVDFQDETRASGGNRGSDAGRQKNSKLFIRNVSSSVTESALQSLFEQVGTVLSAKIPTDRETGMTRGFAFVEMADSDQAEKAIEALNNTQLGGQDLSVNYQDPSRSKAGAGSGGRGGSSRSGYDSYSSSRY
jgi:RNA recognition motif-containing protein